MKKEIKILSYLLGVALLSSCTSKTKEDVIKHTNLENHKYLVIDQGLIDYQFIHNPECEKKDMITLLDSLNKSKWTSKCIATIYYSKTKALTYSGDRIPKGYRRRVYKWLALSKDLLAKYPMNSKVIISGISPELDGEYQVKDKTNNRFNKRVDLLVHKKDNIKGLWKNIKIQKIN